jgi:HEPN domain-containing protein
MLPETREEAAAWLRKATEDLRAAGHDLQAAPPLLEDVLFHSQQAVEKALKAFLVCYDQPFRKTHDLDLLAAECERIDPALKPTLEPIREFTVFAWIFRYPGEPQTPPREDCVRVLDFARRVVDVIRGQIE